MHTEIARCELLCDSHDCFVRGLVDDCLNGSMFGYVWVKFKLVWRADNSSRVLQCLFLLLCEHINRFKIQETRKRMSELFRLSFDGEMVYRVVWVSKLKIN